MCFLASQTRVVSEVGVLEMDAVLSTGVYEGPPLSLHSRQDDSAAQRHGQENESDSTAVLPVLDVLPVSRESLEEAESSVPFETDIPKETLVLQPSETPVLLVPQPGPNSLGGTVNLILSIGKKGEREAPASQAGTLQPKGEEALHKVGT